MEFSAGLNLGEIRSTFRWWSIVFIEGYLVFESVFSEIEEDSGGLEAEGIGDIMIHEDCL